MSDVLHTVINSVYVQTLPTEQPTSVVTFFSRRHDPFTHACQGQASNGCWTDFSECVIVIVSSICLPITTNRSVCRCGRDRGTGQRGALHGRLVAQIPGHSCPRAVGGRGGARRALTGGTGAARAPGGAGRDWRQKSNRSRTKIEMSKGSTMEKNSGKVQLIHQRFGASSWRGTCCDVCTKPEVMPNDSHPVERKHAKDGPSRCAGTSTLHPLTGTSTCTFCAVQYVSVTCWTRFFAGSRQRAISQCHFSTFDCLTANGVRVVPSPSPPCRAVAC